MSMKVTILGCGTSSGVPSIDGGWGECEPTEPRNRRRRFSVLVETKDTTLLIDSSPDCRAQLLDAGVRRLDAVLYTHAHADHCHGIDDLRWVCCAMNGPIPVYGSPVTLRTLQEKFPYCFTPLASEAKGYHYKPVLLPHEVEEPFEIKGIPIIPFSQNHGFSISTGYRISDFACSTDAVRLDETAFACLEGIKLWVVDALRLKPHPTHSHVAQTLQWIKRVGPEQAILTHMGNDMDYRTLSAQLPDGVVMGYDGLTVKV